MVQKNVPKAALSLQGTKYQNISIIGRKQQILILFMCHKAKILMLSSFGHGYSTWLKTISFLLSEFKQNVWDFNIYYKFKQEYQKNIKNTIGQTKKLKLFYFVVNVKKVQFDPGDPGAKLSVRLAGFRSLGKIHYLSSKK